MDDIYVGIMIWKGVNTNVRVLWMISTALMSQIYIVNIINKISATLLLSVLLFAKRFAGLDVITLLSTNENARGVL